MTLEWWRECLRLFASRGNRSEALMAFMLLECSRIDDLRVEQLFDRYASAILEAAG